MKKVLVTGATGFLGKYVVEELVDHGYQVRAFGRNHTIWPISGKCLCDLCSRRFDKTKRI